MTKPRELMLPVLRSSASVAPGTLNEGARTVEVIFYSGATVDRFPPFDDPYRLSFSLDKGAVRLDRFNAGAPLVDNHSTFGSVSESVLGVIEKAWLADDGGHAQVKIAADKPEILARIKDGVLRNFSMGARIHQLRDVTEKGDATKHFMAIDWEPQELSIVPIPADPGAQALAEQRPERFRCVLVDGASSATKETRMSDLTKADLAADDAKPGVPASSGGESITETARLFDEAIERDKARKAEFQRLGDAFGCDELFIARHFQLGTSAAKFAELAAADRAGRAPKTVNDIAFGDDYDSVPWRSDRMVEALEARALRKAPPEAAKQYAYASFSDIARETLEWNKKVRGVARDDKGRLIELALHTTSDFPLILGNLLNKVMLPAYENAQPTYRRIAAQKTFNDFRAHNFLRAGDFPIPLQTNEHGEFKYGTMSENREQVTLATYGRIIGFSRQSLVNDDVGGFADMAAKAGTRIVDFENATFFTNCVNAGSGLGPTLSDSIAVYNASHNNTTSAGALSNTLLGEAWSKMMQQTSLDGLKLNNEPRILLVPTPSVALARALTKDIPAAQASNVNVFTGLEVIADANLGIGTRFYVLADPGRLPNYVYGYLGGASGPRSEVRQGFEIDGVEFKIAIDFGVGAIDYRGGVTGAGV